MAEFASKSRHAIRNILILKEFSYPKAPVASRPQTVEPSYACRV